MSFLFALVAVVAAGWAVTLMTNEYIEGRRRWGGAPYRRRRGVEAPTRRPTPHDRLWNDLMLFDELELEVSRAAALARKRHHLGQQIHRITHRATPWGRTTRSLIHLPPAIAVDVLLWDCGYNDADGPRRSTN